MWNINRNDIVGYSMVSNYDELVSYIRSSFNIGIDVDAAQFTEGAKLRLLNKPLYKVFVSKILFPELRDKQDQYEELVKRAFPQYSAALLNMINFEIVKSPAKADIEINFVKSTKDYAGMHHQQDYSNTKHRISVGVIDTDGSIVSLNTVSHVILHEIGHAVGLGHSPNGNDIMGLQNLNTTKLSANDIFVIQLIYSIGANKTFADEEKYINDCINEFIRQNNSIKEKKQIINDVHKVPEDLMKKLDSISDYKKYKILLQDIKLAFS